MTEAATIIRDFIRQQANVKADDDLFSDDVDLLDYGYLDSFGIVSLIELIESRFGVDLSNVDFYEKENRTISGICKLTETRVAAKS